MQPDPDYVLNKICFLVHSDTFSLLNTLLLFLSFVSPIMVNKTMLKLFTKLSFHTYNTIKISYFDSLTHITGTQTC